MKMEPNNLEKQMAEKLNLNEIEPSAMAWERLNFMLSNAPVKKTKRSFNWVYLAASILIFATAGIFLFNTKETVFTTNKRIVNTKRTENKNSEIKIDKLKKQEIGLAASTQKSEKSNNPIVQKSSQFINQSIQNQNEDGRIQEEMTLIKTESRLTVLDIKEENNLTPSIKKEKSIDAKIKVDANSLLSQVDSELEQDFREKVINKISRNYKEIKIVLETRNQN